jgi:hypothetical protein
LSTRTAEPQRRRTWAASRGLSSRAVSRAAARASTAVLATLGAPSCACTAAVALLAESIAVATVSERVGYENACTFVAAFGRPTGTLREHDGRARLAALLMARPCTERRGVDRAWLDAQDRAYFVERERQQGLPAHGREPPFSPSGLRHVQEGIAEGLIT